MDTSAIQLEARRNAEAALAPSTRRGYAQAWAAWERFAQASGSRALPADPDAVRLYLSALGANAAPATVSAHAAAIATLHRDSGHPSPCSEAEVRKIVMGHKRRHGAAQRQARALDAEAAASLIAAAPRRRIGRAGRLEGESTAARRAAIDIALVSVMRDAMLRRAEAAALVWGDVERAPDGSGRLTVARSKTDQLGEGAVLYLSPATMERLGRLQNPWVFPYARIFTLSASQICRRIAAAAKAAGLGEGFSGHSPRVGMACDLARAGAGLVDLMTAGRWESPRMPARYTRNEQAGRGAVARFYQGEELA